jgi:tRNA G10  N-methylase Trm11
MRKILDPCCGEKRWQRGNLDRFISCDILRSVQPDVVADMCNLPFPAGTFDAVRFDPPHLIRDDVKHWSETLKRYGNWKTRRQMERAFDLVNTEFHRVTKAGAGLLVKIVDGRSKMVTKAADLFWFTKWKQIKQYSKPSRVAWSTNTTLWTWFRRL